MDDGRGIPLRDRDATRAATGQPVFAYEFARLVTPDVQQARWQGATSVALMRCVR